MEGCLYLWDLRESSAHHKNSISEKYHIERGLRKPCYTTHAVNPIHEDALTASLKLDGENSHLSSIVHIESIGDATTSAVVSNFASLDSTG